MVRLLCLCVLMEGIWAGNVVFANESAADILYEKGLSDMQAKKYQDAEKAFLTAIDVYAKHYKSYFRLGELCETTNRLEDAVKNYNTALAILLEKETLNADETRARKEIELALQKTDKLGARYRAVKNDCVNALSAIVEEAKKEKRTDLLEKIYADILYLDPQNAVALKGRKDIATQAKPADAVKTPPSMKDFHDIFNGKDLDSWKKEENKKWDLKGGEILVSNPQRYSSYLTYKDRSFDDKYSIAVKFKAEYAYSDRNTIYGAGIYFGFVNLDRNFYVVRADDGYVTVNCCELTEDAAGSLRNYQNVEQFIIDNYKTGDWNVLMLQVNKQEITVYFNDVLVCESLKLEDKTSGKIGVMAGEGSVRVKEIKAMGK